jgi:hypothetical protein
MKKASGALTLLRGKKGQTVLELGILLIVLVSALIAMQVYVKRGIQGRLKGAVDSVGEQYDPQATASDFTTAHESSVTTSSTTEPQLRNFTIGGVTVTKTVEVTTSTIRTDYDNTLRTGYEAVAAP